MRRMTMAAVLLVLGAATTACSRVDGPDSSYCKDLSGSRKTLESLRTNDLDSLGETFDAFKRLDEKAPDAIEKDWDGIVSATGEVEDALKTAGLKPSDLGAIQKGHVPRGITADDLQPVADAMEAMTSTKLSTAMANIEKHANSVCEIPLDTL